MRTAKLCKTHPDHARRVVREHRGYYQQRCDEQLEEDRAWEREQRDEARARQAADNAWVTAGVSKMRARLDQLIADDDPRVALAALKLKKSWAKEHAAYAHGSDDERVQRVLDALARSVETDPTEP